MSGPPELEAFPVYAIHALRRLGLNLSDDELAVIEAVDSIYAGVILALMELDLAGVEPEPDLDLSRAPSR